MANMTNLRLSLKEVRLCLRKASAMSSPPREQGAQGGSEASQHEVHCEAEHDGEQRDAKVQGQQGRDVGREVQGREQHLPDIVHDERVQREDEERRAGEDPGKAGASRPSQPCGQACHGDDADDDARPVDEGAAGRWSRRRDGRVTCLFALPSFGFLVWRKPDAISRCTPASCLPAPRCPGSHPLHGCPRHCRRGLPSRHCRTVSRLSRRC